VEIRKILVDTSAWLALTDRRERYYGTAVHFHQSLPPTTRRITSWGILSETYTWLRYRAGYPIAWGWLDQIGALENQSFLEVVYPDARTEPGVRRQLARFSDQDLSYVDGFSLHIVQARGDIDAIFAFDHHLTLAGIPVLPGPLAAPSDKLNHRPDAQAAVQSLTTGYRRWPSDAR
jgi:predicted nucleic acid-binding protein